jgi:hypothetical protein
MVSRYATRTGAVSTFTPNLRASRSSATATWVSPRPRSTVWCVSSLRSTCKQRILGLQPGDRAAELVVVGLRARHDRDAVLRDGDLDPVDAHRQPLRRQRVAGVHRRELGDGGEIAGRHLGDRHLLLAAQDEQAVQAFVGAGARC